MSRRQAREIALQSLFQLDFNECEVDSAIENVLSLKGDKSTKLVLMYQSKNRKEGTK